MYIYRILCAVLTARGSDIIKITALKTPDLYVRTVERMDTLISQCKNPTKCINCGKGHSPKSNTCETWLKEKAIMKLKVTHTISYLEAKKMHENQPKMTFSKIVQSIARPEMKDASTQYKTKDF